MEKYSDEPNREDRTSSIQKTGRLLLFAAGATVATGAIELAHTGINLSDSLFFVTGMVESATAFAYLDTARRRRKHDASFDPRTAEIEKAVNAYQEIQFRDHRIASADRLLDLPKEDLFIMFRKQSLVRALAAKALGRDIAQSFRDYRVSNYQKSFAREEKEVQKTDPKLICASLTEKLDILMPERFHYEPNGYLPRQGEKSLDRDLAYPYRVVWSTDPESHVKTITVHSDESIRNINGRLPGLHHAVSWDDSGDNLRAYRGYVSEEELINPLALPAEIPRSNLLEFNSEFIKAYVNVSDFEENDPDFYIMLELRLANYNGDLWPPTS